MTYKPFIRLCFGLLALSLGSLTATAQPSATRSEANDPKAKALLEKVEKLYSSFGSLESSFTLTLSIPKQKGEIQKGTMWQQGDKFRVEMNKQLIISDGKSVWTKSGNKCQIRNLSSKASDNLMSPRDLMRIYRGKEFTYAVLSEGAEGWSSKATTVIFKPNKRNSEYTQIRVVIDQKTNYIVSMAAYGRDQSRYTLSLNKPQANVKIAANKFTFNAAEFPGVKVEDLRID